MSQDHQETAFPVIFFDGEREFSVGNLKISAMQDYKTFMHVVSHHIRVSPTQISIFLVDPTSLGKILISPKTNFAHLRREPNCFLLVILKRSRTQKPSTGELIVPQWRVPCPQTYPVPDGSVFVPQNVTLLRPPQHHLHDLIAQQYLNPYGLVSSNHNEGFPRIQEVYPKMIMEKPILKYCEECRIAERNGKVADFHHCVDDEVVRESRPCRFGPIGPSRKQRSLRLMDFYF